MFEVTVPFPEESLSFPTEVPVFPLEGASLLPGEPMPLHIFENQFKIMTEFALVSGKLIAIVGVNSGQMIPGGIFGLGRIAMNEQLPDGRFNLILIGLKRIRILSITQETPYPKAEIEVLEDDYSQTAVNTLNALSKEIYSLVRDILKIKKDRNSDIVYADLDNLPYDLLPLGMLCDIYSTALALPPLEKRMILEEIDAVKRAEKLIFTLRFELSCLSASGSSQMSLQ
jgi:hypothetical protein